MKLEKRIIIIMIISTLLLVACTNNNENNENYELKQFNECLAENGVVIYGSEWCPACNALVQKLGGKEAVKPVYVECTIEQERCSKETKTNFIPEIQINNEVYEGTKTLEALSELTGCEIP